MELVKPVNVVGLELVARDDQDVVGQLALVQVFEHSEGVRPDLRQERIGRPVEQLDRRDMRLEVAVTDQLLNRLGVGHERDGLVLAPQAVGVPDAVGAAQRAALDVVETQAALPVLHYITGTVG
jgi:hypothetical protein